MISSNDCKPLQNQNIPLPSPSRACPGDILQRHCWSEPFWKAEHNSPEWFRSGRILNDTLIGQERIKISVHRSCSTAYALSAAVREFKISWIRVTVRPPLLALVRFVIHWKCVKSVFFKRSWRLFLGLKETYYLKNSRQNKICWFASSLGASQV